MSRKAGGVLVAVLVVSSVAAKWLYLTSGNALELSPDEAHYWDWSRHPQWSYYSKGPLVAWLIGLSCYAWGDACEACYGSMMPAVRLPALLCSSLTLVGLYVLGLRVLKNPWLACAGCLGALTVPAFHAGSLLMTIDAPYTSAWMWALYTAVKAVEDERPSDWVLLGAIIGIGFLAKYTMVLFYVGLVIYLVCDVKWQRAYVRYLLAAICMSLVCAVPVVYWNAENGWVTLWHVGRQAGVRETSGIRWYGPLVFIAEQGALLLGWWFLAWMGSLYWCVRQWKRGLPSGVKLIVAVSASVWVAFGLFSVATKVEVNWPITAYMAAPVLVAWWMRDRVTQWGRWQRATWITGSLVACIVGATVSVLMLDTRRLYAVAERVEGWPGVYRWVATPRRWDPTNRLRGWRDLAQAVNQLRQELQNEGIEPYLAAGSWSYPGIIAFYLADHPPVCSLAIAAGGRHSQYDLWRPNPIEDAEAFTGATMIYVGNMTDVIRQAFGNIEGPYRVETKVGPFVVASHHVYVCRRFMDWRDRSFVKDAGY